MIRRATTVAAVAWASVLMACAAPESRQEATLDGPPSRVVPAAANFYEQYGAALAGGHRERVPGFYHRDGATIVFNGDAQRQSHEEIRRFYAATWVAPQFFAWDSLHFDSLSTSQVIVTGGFRWQAQGAPDTTRFIYAALLVAVDSGMALVFEHETLRPPP